MTNLFYLEISERKIMKEPFSVVHMTVCGLIENSVVLNIFILDLVLIS